MADKDVATAVFVIGGSPAILAETLAAYINEESTFIPNHVCVITTVEGKERLDTSYDSQGGWQAFVLEYPEYQHLAWHDIDVQVAGNLRDICSESDNHIMMKSIFYIVRDVASSSGRILASIAGGRKTMSYYLGLAMSLFAKENDVLTHVLVPPEWERERGFLFPKREEIHKVNLIQTPFIRLHRFLTLDIKNANVEEIIAAAQHRLDIVSKPILTVDYRTREVEFLGKRVEIPAREFTFLRFFLQQKRRYCTQKSSETCDGCHDCYLDWHGFSQEDKLEDLHAIRAIYAKGPADNAVAQFQNTWSSFEAFKEKFPELRSRLNVKLQEGLGLDPRVQEILLKKVSEQGYSRHGIGVDKSQIEIKGTLGK